MACSAGTSLLLQAGSVSVAGDADQRKRHAVGIGKRQDAFAESMLDRAVRHAFLDEAMGPVSKRPGGNAKRRFLRLSHARAARRGVLPRKEGEDGAGAARRIAIIEMIGAGVVEVHGLLDEAQAEHTSIEIVVTQRIA